MPKHVSGEKVGPQQLNKNSKNKYFTRKDGDSDRVKERKK
jgi:hypothetical protein